VLCPAAAEAGDSAAGTATVSWFERRTVRAPVASCSREIGAGCWHRSRSIQMKWCRGLTRAHRAVAAAIEGFGP
jgi:hypothetical protein